ncbi:MAG: DUF4810 domain-containing protein [Bacteroidales bacterium]|nr:DUF4810 domain-containing protein [Bacteroidales bacterium]
MKKVILFFTICVGMMSLSSCATSTLYSWNDYEDASYEYSKVGSEEQKEKLIKQFEKMKKQTGLRKTVPPGYYAEYGFLLVKEGKTEEGVAMLKKEIELYPESTIYISRIIKQLEK